MTQPKRAIFLGVLILAGVVSVRGAGRYTFDQNGSNIRFEVRHLLGKARGQFHQFSGTITLDRDEPERSAVSTRIEVVSIDTGIGKRDDHLRSADFLDVTKYPAITFNSRSVKRISDSAGEVTGDLTMHGVTHPIVLRVELVNNPTNARTRWKVTTAPLKRRDFGLLFGGTAEAVSRIGQDVAVNIEIEARRAQ
jgi:polyisoprenoid-binding protein YceI